MPRISRSATQLPKRASARDRLNRSLRRTPTTIAVRRRVRRRQQHAGSRSGRCCPSASSVSARVDARGRRGAGARSRARRPCPRFAACRSTSAPADAARAAVSSAEPSSTTTTVGSTDARPADDGRDARRGLVRRDQRRDASARSRARRAERAPISQSAHADAHVGRDAADEARLADERPSRAPTARPGGV